MCSHFLTVVCVTQKNKVNSAMRREAKEQIQRYILQLFMANDGFLPEKVLETEFNAMLGKFNVVEGSEFTLEDMRVFVNRNISSLSLILKKHRFEVDGSTYWSLANKYNDDVAKVYASRFSRKELLYLKRIVNSLLESRGIIMDAEAIGLRVSNQSGGNCTSSEAHLLLDRFHDSGWIYKDTEDVRLGPRAFMELEDYIQQKFVACPVCPLCLPGSDLEQWLLGKCFVCHRISVSGFDCSNFSEESVDRGEACSVRMHRSCCMKFFKNQTARKCTECANGNIQSI